MPRGCREPTGFRNSPHSKPEVGGSPSGLRASELAKFQRYCLLSPSMPRAQPLKSQPFPHPHSKQVPSDHMWPTHALGSKKGPALYILREALASCSLTQCFLSIHSALGRGGSLPECCPPAPDPASPGDASSSMGKCWSALHTRPPGLGQASKAREGEGPT